MSGNPRRREVRALTLGFLSLGANAAPLDVLSAAAEAGFGAVGLRVSGRNPGDPWPQPNAEGDGLERIRARAEALSIRISSISGYYMSEKTSLSHLLANVEAARRVGRCPLCGRPTDRAHRPFCSRRCADIDLGRWLGEKYRVSRALDLDDEFEELVAGEDDGR